jgi:hypothetical protein
VKKLSTFKRTWKREGYKVEFFGLDLSKQELIPLDKFVELVKSLFEAKEV